MTYIKSYKDLIVWQKAMELARSIFKLTDEFPRSELYGLTSQMRRAAVSIPSNIAEGYGRKSKKEYSQFYSIAYGSGLELETQLMLSRDLGFCRKSVNWDKSESLLNEVLRMLNSMIRNLMG